MGGDLRKHMEESGESEAGKREKPVMGIMGALMSGLLPRVTGAPSHWGPTEEESRTHLNIVLGRDEEAGAFIHPPLPLICWMLTHRHQSLTIFGWLIGCDDPLAPKKTTRQK